MQQPMRSMKLIGLAVLFEALAVALAETLAEPERSLALEVDDECHAAGGEASDRCSLNALQRSRSTAALARVNGSEPDLPGHDFIKDCHDDVPGKECPGGLTCVSKPDRTWSQCVDCSSAAGFGKDCIMMGAEMREVATAACGRSCPYTTPKPIASGCASAGADACSGEHEKCVTTADGTWSQCVDCSSQFYKDCQMFDSPVRLAAVLACKRTCVGTKCEGSEWCRSPYKCIGDKTWAQCLRCDSSKTFKYACKHWTSQFRGLVEGECDRKCQR